VVGVAVITIEGNWVEHGLQLDGGRARVNTIDVHHDTPEFMAIEIDMLSKYIQPVISWGNGGEKTEIILMAFENALYLDETTQLPTVLHLPVRNEQWEVVATGGRYTIQIAAWKRRGEL
jgi:hypothetical protein